MNGTDIIVCDSQGQAALVLKSARAAKLLSVRRGMKMRPGATAPGLASGASE